MIVHERISQCKDITGCGANCELYDDQLCPECSIENTKEVEPDYTYGGADVKHIVADGEVDGVETSEEQHLNHLLWG